MEVALNQVHAFLPTLTKVALTQVILTQVALTQVALNQVRATARTRHIHTKDLRITTCMYSKIRPMLC